MTDRVVKLTRVRPRVGLIVLEDRDNKNCFTDQLMQQLGAAFAEVSADPALHAVIMTGYESFFCSGATKDILVRLQEGQARFSDGSLYSLALDCPVPVIAAMQGHAIGGGLVFGLFADFAVLSRESVYTANFMKYGFTPGMGATLVCPHKLGPALGNEMLLSARSYRGQDLAQRGAPFPVLPRAEVLDHALRLADDLANMPRESLTLLKAHLNRDLRERLPDTITRELKMHETSLKQVEVTERIEALFGR
jgi:polyketide biosynthesis enoyl-CoA hydratase PksI